MKHPIQKVFKDDRGAVRFVKNEVVDFIMTKLKIYGFSLNELHHECNNASIDDWDQFNQLIGYSVEHAPLYNEEINTIAYKAFENNSDPNSSQEKFYETKYNIIKEQLKPIVANLYDLHPDDLS